ncbi:glutamate oxaloacetate transaminase 1 [Arctopsyche grandis]|uniref:glutamate oxaloacetate transaminase 1 n=1 Tax=Arctopsyche grandis TaxID=121162 RepID=UPI00406D6F5C
MESSNFSIVEQAPPVEVFALMKAFTDDPHPQKVNLGAGVYRDNDGKPWVLPIVRKVEKMMSEDATLNHEYLPILGFEPFASAATSMLLGADSPSIKENRAFGVHSLSGTGSLRIGANFLVQHMKRTIYYYPKPTWENHNLVFANAGFSEGRTYRYWKPETRGIDFEGLLEDLGSAPAGAVVILHACAHNPTGCDPTKEQWEKIAEVVKAKNLFPFFDSAYQGFASGDLEKDSWVVRYFDKLGFEFICAQSFAKNFGLYGERVGNLAVVLNNADLVLKVKSQFTILVRGMYSNPPTHGAKIVNTVLRDENLFNEWKECIKTMSSRIINMRKALYEELVQLKTPGTWEHIINQIGMFSYTGLTEKQVQHLREKHHIYLLKTGRISMCGINTNNVKYTAAAFNDAIISVPE